MSCESQERVDWLVPHTSSPLNISENQSELTSRAVIFPSHAIKVCYACSVMPAAGDSELHLTGFDSFTVIRFCLNYWNSTVLISESIINGSVHFSFLSRGFSQTDWFLNFVSAYQECTSLKRLHTTARQEECHPVWMHLYCSPWFWLVCRKAYGIYKGRWGDQNQWDYSLISKRLLQGALSWSLL